MLNINRLTNANIYLDGGSLLGQAEEVSLPEVKHTTSEHKALGMVGKLELFSGIDKLEMKIKFNSFYPATFKKIANPTKAYQLQVRANLETHSGGGLDDEQPIVVYVTGRFKSLPLGVFKQHDNVELETMLIVTSIKVELAGAVQYEIDIMANTYKVDGVDILQNYRTNIGG